MTRALPIAILLLIVGCGPQDNEAALASNEAAVEQAAPAAAASTPSLEGDWRVTMIEGQDAAGLGMAAVMGAGKATISTGCIRRAWTYTQDRNIVAFTASPSGSANCGGQSPSSDAEAAYAALDGANIAIFAKDGKEATLSGTGGTLTLQRR